MKTYILRRDFIGAAKCIVRDGQREYYLPNVARDISESFNWGYNGSAPSALAYSILADLLGDGHRDLFYSEWVKEDIIARVPDTGGMLLEEVLAERLADYRQFVTAEVR